MFLYSVEQHNIPVVEPKFVLKKNHGVFCKVQHIFAKKEEPVKKSKQPENVDIFPEKDYPALVKGSLVRFQQTVNQGLTPSKNESEIEDEVLEFLKAVASFDFDEFLSQKNIFGQNPLHVVAHRGMERAVDFMIKNCKNKELLNSQDDAGRTALHFAAAKGNLTIVRILTQNETEKQVKVQDKQGNTPLHIAAANGNDEIVKWWMRLQDIKEYDQWIPNNKGQIAVQLAVHFDHPEAFEAFAKGPDLGVLNHEDKNRHRALEIGIKRGVKEKTMNMVKKHSPAMEGKTELVKKENYGVASTLTMIDQGVQIRKELMGETDRTLDNETVLHFMVFSNECTGLNFFEANDFSDMIFTSDVYGNTPLHLAVLQGSVEMTKALLEQCKDFKISLSQVLKIKNNGGQTPLDLALKLGRHDIAETLKCL